MLQQQTKMKKEKKKREREAPDSSETRLALKKQKGCNV